MSENPLSIFGVWVPVFASTLGPNNHTSLCIYRVLGYIIQYYNRRLKSQGSKRTVYLISIICRGLDNYGALAIVATEAVAVPLKCVGPVSVQCT